MRSDRSRCRMHCRQTAVGTHLPAAIRHWRACAQPPAYAPDPAFPGSNRARRHGARGARTPPRRFPDRKRHRAISSVGFGAAASTSTSSWASLWSSGDRANRSACRPNCWPINASCGGTGELAGVPPNRWVLITKNSERRIAYKPNRLSREPVSEVACSEACAPCNHFNRRTRKLQRSKSPQRFPIKSAGSVGWG